MGSDPEICLPHGAYQGLALCRGALMLSGGGHFAAALGRSVCSIHSVLLFQSSVDKTAFLTFEIVTFPVFDLPPPQIEISLTVIDLRPPQLRMAVDTVAILGLWLDCPSLR